MRAVLFIIKFILAHDKANAIFQFVSGEAFLTSSCILFFTHSFSLSGVVGWCDGPG